MIADIAGDQFAYKDLADLHRKLLDALGRVAERRRLLADEDRQLRKKERLLLKAVGPRSPGSAAGDAAGLASTK